MKRARKSAIGAALVLTALTVISCCLFSQTPPSSDLKPELSALSYFAGDWDCSGKFDSSGKSINAHQNFAPELGGAWMFFRHDDKPPFSYHALSEWGWDANGKQFVMTAQDNFGGVRLFHSSGWNLTQLQWDGDAIGATTAPAQRFTFERIDDHHFKVSYFTRKADNWSRVDASTCSKQ